MPESDTLLAYLVSSFPGNTENIATEALRHIFDQSDASIEALNDVVQSGVRGIEPIQKVRTQVVHADGTIPDLVGFDVNRKERVLVEVKFWAGLTANQPNGYLNRLPDDGPSVLVFLAPEDRIQSLWPQLRNRITRKEIDLVDVDAERKCLRLGNTQRHLMVVSWSSLLDSMATRSRDAESGSHIEAEIRQLRSLAKFADAGAIKPIRRGEEFGADSEVRKRQYKRLIDAATERGIRQEWVNRKGLRATPRSYGYGRYIRLHGNMVWFGVNVNQFERTGKTPLWVDCFRYSSRLKEANLSEELELQDGGWAPVKLKRDVEYPEMLEGVVDSLKYIADALYGTRFPSIRDKQESAHGEPLNPIIRRPDGSLVFPDGSEGRPGHLTEDQQRRVDLQEAAHLYGTTGDASGLIRLGIMSGEQEDETD